MRKFYPLLFFCILAGCSSEDPVIEDIINDAPPPTKNDCKLIEGWSIPPSEIVGGGVGKEGIASLENPTFIPASEASYLSGDDLVVGVEINGQVRLFPHRIMDRHEIANDEAADTRYSLTFCPLTGSTVAISRESDDSFGVSGLLHNSNLIYYNRATNDFWAQMKLSAIKGNQVCEDQVPMGTVEMTWTGWKQSVSDLLVLDLNTGFDKDYSESFSGAILEHNTPLWPYSPKDTRLENFEKVYVVLVDGFPKAYPLNLFDSENQIIQDQIQGKELIIIANKQTELITVLLAESSGTYTVASNGGNLQISKNGKHWNIFGNPVSGTTKSLEKPAGYMAYWFSVGAMFPNIEIYNPHGQD